MVPPISAIEKQYSEVEKKRSERRIAVRLPLRVRGRDSRGVVFEESTSSENLCRNGAAFVTRFDVAIGSDLEIRIPNANSNYTPRRPGTRAAFRNVSDNDFATHGRVVHVGDSQTEGERMVGVQFTGPRFQRLFRSESAA
jgi:PilZ domain-containing protein